jgi:hypothetical protein
MQCLNNYRKCNRQALIVQGSRKISRPDTEWDALNWQDNSNLQDMQFDCEHLHKTLAIAVGARDASR